MTDLDKSAKLENIIGYCSNRDLLGATATDREVGERSNVTEDPGDQKRRGPAGEEATQLSMGGR